MTWWLGGGVEGGGGGGGPEGGGGLTTKQPSPSSLVLLLTLAAAVLWIDPASCQQESPAALPSPALPFTPTRHLANGVVRVSERTHYPPRAAGGGGQIVGAEGGGAGAGGGGGSEGETEEDLREVLPELNLENNTVSEVYCSEGEVALLPCKFPQLSTLHQKSFLLLQVSWLRRADWRILTTGVYTYTTDPRFSVLHRDTSDQWTLQIKYAKARDSGTYECQMYTGTGVASQFVQLHVSRPHSAILGPRHLHVQEGDTVTLVCVIQQGSPSWVFWYHDEQMVNYDTRLSVETHVEGTRTHSRLTITSARSWDSGNYSCLPPNVQASSVFVYVSEAGDTVAAVQRQPSNSATTSLCSVSVMAVMAVVVAVLSSTTCSSVSVMAVVVALSFCCGQQGVLLNLLQAFPVR